jgi:hypothetical protein
VSDPSTLAQLLRLRGNAVDTARHALQQAERARTQSQRVRDRAIAAHTLSECALIAARAQFVGARSVAALRWSAACTENGVTRRARDEARIAVAERQWADACARVNACAQVVRARELEHRAVARTIERRARDVTLRTERRLEDEADDCFRAHGHTP